jgi:hypothetical protein
VRAEIFSASAEIAVTTVCQPPESGSSNCN